MKTILVPCDFSESAISAFRFAIDIANKSNGEIILLHVIELSVAFDTKHISALSFEEQAYLKDAKGNAEKEIDKLITKWAKGGPVITREVQYGIVATAITDFVKEQRVDLIVMGTKGYAVGFNEIIAGSNTEKVVSSSEAPVIAIKKYVKNPIKNIVLANSLIEEKGELVEKIKALQNLFGATLHIVYVNTAAQSLADRETQQRLNDFVKRYTLKDYTISIHTDLDPQTGLINFAKETKADMVAMGTHPRKGLAHIFNGSVAKAVEYHLDCPVWTLKI
jgi:nucleotide-binding universal stress UspA family protein